MLFKSNFHISVHTGFKGLCVYAWFMDENRRMIYFLSCSIAYFDLVFFHSVYNFWCFSKSNIHVLAYTGLKGRCVYMVYGWQYENNIVIQLLYCLFSSLLFSFCKQLLMLFLEQVSCLEGRKTSLWSKYSGMRRRFESWSSLFLLCVRF